MVTRLFSFLSVSNPGISSLYLDEEEGKGGQGGGGEQERRKKRKRPRGRQNRQAPVSESKHKANRKFLFLAYFTIHQQSTPNRQQHESNT